VSEPYLVNVTDPNARRRLVEVEGKLAAADMLQGAEIIDALELESLHLEWPMGAKLVSVVRTRTYAATDVYMKRVSPNQIHNYICLGAAAWHFEIC
jgi:hypothetical protein